MKTKYLFVYEIGSKISTGLTVKDNNEIEVLHDFSYDGIMELFWNNMKRKHPELYGGFAYKADEILKQKITITFIFRQSN